MATSSKVKNHWNGENYDRVYLFLPKGQKEIVKSIADEQGLSLNKYIQVAIIEKMKRDVESKNE